MCLKFPIDEGTREASPIWNKYQSCRRIKTLLTRFLWPWRGYRASRSRHSDSHMPWQPTARLNVAGNESTTESNLIGNSTTKELMTDFTLMLGGLVLEPEL